MRLKFLLAISLWFFATSYSWAQGQIFNEVFQDIMLTRFWQYEEIPVDLQVKGPVQVDLTEGLNYLMVGNPAIAETHFTRALEKDSTLWQAWYFRAASRKLIRKLWYAEKDLTRTLALRPDFYEGQLELAKLYFLTRRLSESERIIKKAIQLDKKKPAGYFLKGDIDFIQNKVKSAISNYNDCLAADSLFHDARIKLAIIDLVTNGDEALVLGRLQRVLEIDPGQKNALLSRSVIVFEKDKEQSVRDLSKLISVSPNNIMAIFLRGMALTELREFTKAFNDFQRVIQATEENQNSFMGQQTWLDKRIDIQNAGAYMLPRLAGLPKKDVELIKLGYCYLITEQYDKGVAYLDQVSNPKAPLVLYLKAVAHEHKGAHQKAFLLYDEVLKQDNEIADAHKKRGIYEQELGQWDESVDDFNAVLRITSEAFVIYKIRGVSFFNLNRFKNAIIDFNEYLTYDPDNREVLSYRALAYQKDDQPLNAYLDFVASGKLQALNYSDMDKEVNAVLLKGDTVTALYALDKFTTASVFFTEGFVQKFKIHMARNEWDQIDKDIEWAIKSSRVEAGESANSFLLTVQAMSFARKGKQSEAMDTFDKAIKTDKMNALAFLERGKLFRLMGKESKAEGDFKAALALGNKEAQKMLKR